MGGFFYINFYRCWIVAYEIYENYFPKLTTQGEKY